jgi:hypothetical protein
MQRRDGATFLRSLMPSAARNLPSTSRFAAVDRLGEVSRNGATTQRFCAR